MDNDVIVEMDQRSPFQSWQEVDVQFGDAHTDTIIPHNLSATNPRDVCYWVVKQFTAGTVYESVAPDALTWTSTYIVLRTDTAGWTGRLHLAVPTQKVPTFPVHEYPEIPVSAEDTSTPGTGFEPGDIGGGLELVDDQITRSEIYGQVTIPRGSNVASIPEYSIAYDKLEIIPNNRILGRTSEGSGPVEHLILSDDFLLNNQSPRQYEVNYIGTDRGARRTGTVFDNALVRWDTSQLPQNRIQANPTPAYNAYLNDQGVLELMSLDVIAQIDLSSGALGILGISTAHNYFHYRVTSNGAGASTIDGLFALTDGGFRMFSNVAGSGQIIKHEYAGADPQDRFKCPGGVNYTIPDGGGVVVYYSTADARWHVLGEGAARILTGDVTGTVGANGSMTTTLASIPSGVQDGITRLGTIATTLAYSGAEKQTGSITPSQITADQNNYNPTGLSTARVLRLSTDAGHSITGLTAQAVGTLVTIVNVGNFDIGLNHADTNSTVTNRFNLPGGTNITINPADSVTLRYDESTYWFAVATAL